MCLRPWNYSAHVGGENDRGGDDRGYAIDDRITCVSTGVSCDDGSNMGSKNYVIGFTENKLSKALIGVTHLVPTL